MRNIAFGYSDSPAFARALREGDHELLLPLGASVRDGEWVLAVFEIEAEQRSTASAGRGLHRGAGSGPVLTFERRDWERLVRFADGTHAASRPDERGTPQGLNGSGHGSAGTPGAGAWLMTSEPPTKPSLLDDLARRRASDPFVQRPNARLLLVDDDHDIREVVAAMLEAVGLAVEAVTSAEEALDRVRADTYDVLVLDWNLPGMTGIELCRILRSDGRLSTLPVLFLTAHASSHDVVDAFASGADDYLVKPFRGPELGARIFGLLRRARMTQSSS